MVLWEPDEVEEGGVGKGEEAFKRTKQEALKRMRRPLRFHEDKK